MSTHTPATAREPVLRAEPIPRRKLADEVTERLLAHVRDGTYPEGERMPSERQLMEHFGVGRPAIREALQRLERMGVIAITHGERAIVRPVSASTVIRQVGAMTQHLLSSSPRNLEDLKEVRLFFEVGMVRIAAERATAADVAAIRKALAAHEAALDDLAVFMDRDRDLHRAIAAVSGNPIYIALSEAMFGWLATFHTDLVRVSGAERVTLAEHAKIVECIARHDPQGAAEAMTMHLTRANKLYSLVGHPQARSGRASRKR